LVAVVCADTKQIAVVFNDIVLPLRHAPACLANHAVTFITRARLARTLGVHDEFGKSITIESV